MNKCLKCGVGLTPTYSDVFFPMKDHVRYVDGVEEIYQKDTTLNKCVGYRCNVCDVEWNIELYHLLEKERLIKIEELLKI